MTHGNRTVTVFGGAGFLGRHVVQALARKSFRIKVATRVPEHAWFLRTCGTVGQVVPLYCDYADPASVARAVAGSSAVVNCIGTLGAGRRGKKAMEAAHAEIPFAIAAACAENEMHSLVHVSALGIEGSGSVYARTKRDGEGLVHKRFPGAAILRPSVIFGPGDRFFALFAELARFAPVLPLIGGGHTRFQPVFVGDAADAVLAAASLSGKGASGDHAGKIFELGGPQTMTLREVYEKVFLYTRRRRPMVPVPFGLMKAQAALLSLIPGCSILTPDQVESLRTDSVMARGALSFADLGLNSPKDPDAILPSYLERFCPGGHYGASDQTVTI